MNTPPLRDRSIGIVIPAYRAAKTLPAVLAGLGRLWPPERILVVDDGSDDGTVVAAEAGGILCLRHPENRGKGAALMTGLSHGRASGWEWAVTLDADGQHAGEDLENFMKVRPEPDTGILVGRRWRNGSAMPWHRRFSNKLTTWMVSRLAGRPVHDAQSGYRAYRLDLLDAYPRVGRFEWEPHALILCGRRGCGIEAVPVRTVYGDAGSHIRIARDTWRFLRMVGKLAWTS